jgi:hypothetical protein
MATASPHGTTGAWDAGRGGGWCSWDAGAWRTRPPVPGTQGPGGGAGRRGRAALPRMRRAALDPRPCVPRPCVPGRPLGQAAGSAKPSHGPWRHGDDAPDQPAVARLGARGWGLSWPEEPVRFAPPGRSAAGWEETKDQGSLSTTRHAPGTASAVMATEPSAASASTARSAARGSLTRAPRARPHSTPTCGARAAGARRVCGALAHHGEGARG